MSLGGFSKDKLVFDADVSPLSENDNMGAYVRGGKSGAQITNHSDIELLSGSFNFLDADVSVANDTITEVAHGFNTGDKIQLTTTGVLPAGLALLTNYYVIRVDADTIKLATTWALAEANTAVDITAAAGAGTHTVTRQNREYKALDVWTSYERYEDKPHTSGDKGAFMLAVRHDADTSMVDADGDYAPLQVDENGNLKVIADLDVNFDYVYAEDDASAGSDLGAYVLTIRQDAPAVTTSADGDFQSFKTDNLGRLWVHAVVDSSDVADDAPDSGNPIKVGTRAVSGGPLALISADNDRADMISDRYRRLYVNNGSNIAVLSSTLNVDNIGPAVAAPTSALTGRRTLMIQNLSNKEIYAGGSAGITNLNSFVIAARATISLDLGQDVPLFILGSDSVAQNLRILELA